MLVLDRKRLDEIVVGGNVRIRVIEIRGDQVVLEVFAPTDVPVARQEVAEAVRQDFAARQQRRDSIPHVEPSPT